MTAEDRGNWPRHYGRCRLDSEARSDIARWAFYNIGATMTAREHSEPRGCAPRPACPGCGQLSDVQGPCPSCVALDRAPQGETVRLFEPAPTQLPGQTSLSPHGEFLARWHGGLTGSDDAAPPWTALGQRRH